MARNRVRLFPQAERDLDGIVLHLAEESEPETAIRFLDSAHATFRLLADSPGAGRLRETGNPRLVGIRQWHVADFASYLVFYRPSESGVDVIRVLHGSRDIDRLLADERAHQ